MNEQELRVAAQKAATFDPLDSNCFGFVAWLNGWIPQLIDLKDYEMAILLKDHTVEVSDLQVGDILVHWYTSCGFESLVHTTVYLGQNQVVHKDGPEPIQFTDIETVRKSRYDIYELYDVRRPV